MKLKKITLFSFSLLMLLGALPNISFAEELDSAIIEEIEDYSEILELPQEDPIVEEEAILEETPILEPTMINEDDVDVGGGYISEFVDWYDENYYPELQRNNFGNVFVSLDTKEASYEKMADVMPDFLYGIIYGEIRQIPIISWDYYGSERELNYKEYTEGWYSMKPVLLDGYSYEKDSLTPLSLRVENGGVFSVAEISGNTASLTLINDEKDIPEEYRHFMFGQGTITEAKNVNGSVKIYKTSNHKTIDGKDRIIYIRETITQKDSTANRDYCANAPCKVIYGATALDAKGTITAKYDFIYYDDENVEHPVRIKGLSMVNNLDKESNYYNNTDIPDAITASGFDRYYAYRGNYLGISGNYVYGKDAIYQGNNQPAWGSATWKKMGVFVAYDTTSFSIKYQFGYARGIVLDSWKYDYRIETSVENGTIDESIFGITSGEDKTIKYNAYPNYRLSKLIVNGQEIDFEQYPDEYTFSNITSNQTIKVVYDPSANLTINYLEKGSNKTLANAYGPTAIKIGDTYAVKSPEIKLYKLSNPEEATVTGTMPNTDTVLNVFYEPRPAKELDFEVRKMVFNSKGEDINGKYVNVGDELKYEIFVKNPSLLESTFYFKDVVPEGTELKENATKKEMTWEKKIKGQEEDSVSFVVVATKPGVLIQNSAEVYTDPVEKDIRKSNVVKNWTPAAPIKQVADQDGNDVDKAMVLVGDVITYSIKVKNIADVEKTAIVTDEIPAGVEFVSADNLGVSNEGKIRWEIVLKAGEEKVVSFKARVLDDSKGIVIANKAKIEFDGKPIETNVVENPSMKDPIKEVFSGDQDVAGQMVGVGEHLTYKITFENNGELEKEFVITDKLPNNTKFVSVENEGEYDPATKMFTWTKKLAANTSETVSFTVETTRHGSYIPNIASVSVDAKTLTTNKVENTTMDSVMRGDIVTVYKKSDPVNGSAVNPNQEILYTLVIKNTGDFVSGTTTIMDPLASEITYVEDSASDGGVYENGIITWTVSNLAPQEVREVTFKAIVNSDVKDVLIRNYADYSTDTDLNEGVKTTNEVIHSVGNVELPPTLEVSKEVSPVGEVRKEDILLYKLHIKNNGSLAKDVAVVDSIPEGTEFIEAENNGVYNATKNRVEWFLDSLDKDEEQTLSFFVRVKLSEGFVYNQAQFDHNVPETDLPTLELENSTNITETPVIPYTIKGDLVTVHKSANPASGSKVENGQEITYRLEVKNTGLAVSGTTVLKDPIPENTSYVEGSATEGGKLEGEAIVWTIKGIEPGKSKVVEFKVKVNSGDESVIIRNHATYNTDTDQTKEDKSTNETVHGTGDAPIPAVLEVIKTSDKPKIVVKGEEITYSLQIKNNGGSTSHGTILVDPIPAGVDFVSADNNGKLNSSAKRVEWYIGELKPNESKTVTFKAKVTADKGLIYNQALFGNGVPEQDLPNYTPTNSSNVVENWIPDAPVKSIIDANGNDVSGKELTGNQEYTYVIKVRNASLTEEEFTIEDEIPSKMSIVSADNSGTVSGQKVIWKAKIAAGKEVELKVKVKTQNESVKVENTAILKVGDKQVNSNKVENTIKKVDPPKEPVVNTGENGRNILFYSLTVLLGAMILIVSKKVIRDE